MAAGAGVAEGVILLREMTKYVARISNVTAGNFERHPFRSA